MREWTPWHSHSLLVGIQTERPFWNIIGQVLGILNIHLQFYVWKVMQEKREHVPIQACT